MFIRLTRRNQQGWISGSQSRQYTFVRLFVGLDCVFWWSMWKQIEKCNQHKTYFYVPHEK